MEAELSEFSVFDFDDILDATDNFSEENKLGEGGFGPVYKVLCSKILYFTVNLFLCNFDYLSYSNNLWKYHLFYYNLFYHQIYF